jgi:hypothetical protein
MYMYYMYSTDTYVYIPCTDASLNHSLAGLLTVVNVHTMYHTYVYVNIRWSTTCFASHIKRIVSHEIENGYNGF